MLDKSTCYSMYTHTMVELSFKSNIES